MLQSYLERRIQEAEKVSASCIVEAGFCAVEHDQLRDKFLLYAQTIDELVDLLRSTARVAKMNHDVIVGMQI